MKRMNVQQLIGVGMAILMVHPALWPAGQALAQERRTEPVPPLIAANRRPVPGSALATKKATPRVAAQVASAFAGESKTLLPDGRILTVGGLGPSGVSARAVVGTALTATPRRPRAWHTATVLPDGTALIFGGIESRGLAQEAEIFDPATQTFEVLVTPGLEARAYHTATLLTDGRVLIAGGIAADGQPTNKLVLWDPRGKTTQNLSAWLVYARRGHTAKLQADGSVLIQGGTTAGGSRPEMDEVYNPETQAVSLGDSSKPESEFRLAGSLPGDGAEDVALDAIAGLRFSRPLKMTTASAAFTLRDSEGFVSAKVVPAEAGMLAFITPDRALKPNTTYTLAISGARDIDDFALGSGEITFTTGSGQVKQQTKSAETDNQRQKDDPAPTSLQASAGVTALSGHSRTSLGKYLQNVTLNLDCAGKTATARTDSQGRFLLISTVAGHCVMEIDGTTARDPGKEYGRFFPGVDLIAGRTNVLPYTIWMTALDRKEVTIPSPTTRNTVITHPSLKGLELHLPANTVIRDQITGQVVTKVTMSPIPIGRPPFPLPPGVAVPFYFTIQPGGAYVEVGGSRYAPGKGAQLIYPNRGRAPAGTEYNFWDYDADGRGWYIYGTGKVDANRKTVVPEPNVVIYRFTGAMVAGECCGPWPPPGGPPDGCGAGGGGGGGGGVAVGDGGKPAAPPCKSDKDGDPVSLSTGLFTYQQTDLALPDVMPIALTRVFRQGYLSGPFGIGSTHPYEIFLVTGTSGYTYIDMILPDGGRVHYTRTSAGTGWVDAVLEHNTTASSYYKSVISWNGNGWDLRLKNGTVYTFPESSGVPMGGIRSAITKMKDRYGNAITMTRNPGTGILQKITSQNGRWISLTYDSANRIAQAADNGGRTFLYQYDEGGRLTQVTNPMSGVTQYTYDANNQMLAIVDPRGNTYMANEYDTEGRLRKQTLADGGIYLFDYLEDVNGNVIQTDVTNPRGYLHRMTFDSTGYFSGGLVTSDIRAVGQPEQQTTTYERLQGSTLIVATVDALNRRTTFGYDSKGNSTSITRLAGTSDASTISFAYEPVSNQVASITDALNHTTVYAYDNNGNLIASTPPATSTVTFVYDGSGRLASASASPLGTVSYEYTGGDRTGFVDLSGQRWLASFDAVGRLLSTSNPLGSISRVEYNVGDRPIKTYNALGALSQFSWDGNGNLLTMTDSRNGSTVYTYDTSNRLTSRRDQLQVSEITEYDKNSNPTKHTDRRLQITQSLYDALDRRILVTYADASTKSLSYDSGNRVTQIVDSVGSTTTYSHDGLNRLLSESGPTGSVTYTYDAAGRRTSMTVNGVSPVSYQYDNADRVTQVTQGALAASLTYDAVGRRSTMTLTNGVIVSYGYDAVSRVSALSFSKGAAQLGNISYKYDVSGRKTKVSGSLARTALPQAVASATYNSANQLTQWNGAILAYDANGNLTSDGALTYTWDVRDQLAGLTGSGMLATFTYDGAGNRRTRTVNGTSTAFLYAGGNLSQETTGANTTNWLSSIGIDEGLARTDASGTQALLADGLNSTFALLDPTGATVSSYTYEPFGNVTSTGASSPNSVQFTGRENDNTGLLFYRARYYSPAYGRFISQDPLPADTPYMYGNNDPLAFVDPLGLTTLTVKLNFRKQDLLEYIVMQSGTEALVNVFTSCSGNCDGRYTLSIRIDLTINVAYHEQLSKKHEMDHARVAQEFWTRHKSDFDQFEGTYDSRSACESAMRAFEDGPAKTLFKKLQDQLNKEQCNTDGNPWKRLHYYCW